MSGKYGSVTDATKGTTRRGNYFDTSRKVGGGRGSQTWGTPYSSMSYGNVTLDPSIRAIQEEGLGQVRQQYGETQTYGDELINNSRGLRERYLGNESAYKQSLINPLLEQVSQRRGELTRNLGTRGLSGSSFGEQSLNNFEIDSGRALTDARSQAEFSNLQALTGVDAQLAQNMFGKVSLEMQLTGMTLAQGKERLAQEMGALQLGSQQQQLMMENFESQQMRGFQERKAIADNISSYFGGGGGGGGKTPKTDDKDKEDEPDLGSSGDSESGGSSSGGSSSGSKIVCTAMNEAYGFGSYRNKIWIKYARDHLTEQHQIGYHAIFMPLVKFGFKSGDGITNRLIRRILENVARHRSADLRAEMKNGKRDKVGMLYRSILEPLCYLVGRLKQWQK